MSNKNLYFVFQGVEPAVVAMYPVLEETEYAWRIPTNPIFGTMGRVQKDDPNAFLTEARLRAVDANKAVLARLKLRTDEIERQIQEDEAFCRKASPAQQK
jgi:hypothetical protein